MCLACALDLCALVGSSRPIHPIHQLVRLLGWFPSIVGRQSCSQPRAAQRPTHGLVAVMAQDVPLYVSIVPLLLLPAPLARSCATVLVAGADSTAV